MKKCEICGKLYDDNFDKCPHSHLFIDKNKHSSEPPTPEETKKGCLSCLGCLGTIIVILALIIIFDKPIPKSTIEPPNTQEVSIKFDTITFSEDDLPYLEKYLNQYFSNKNLKDYNFSFYINPIVWYNLPYAGKEALIGRCAAYGVIKTNQLKDPASVALSKVHILDAYNGQELGGYGLTGYKFK